MVSEAEAGAVVLEAAEEDSVVEKLEQRKATAKEEHHMFG